MYAENLGAVSGACPPEITIPTGSSFCARAACFIMKSTERRVSPERSGTPPLRQHGCHEIFYCEGVDT
jgi:hypothetical protein